MARPTKSLRYYINIHCRQRNQIYRFHHPQSDRTRGFGKKYAEEFVINAIGQLATVNCRIGPIRKRERKRNGRLA